MKIKVVVFAIFFFLLISISSSFSQENQIDALLNNIVADLHRVVFSKPSDSLINKYCTMIFDKINKHELVFNIVKEETPLLSSTGFGFDENGLNPYIVINDKLILRYKTQPSIVLSMLIHEIAHAYFYYTDKYFVQNKDNELEHFFYEMDARRIEAMFILDYLIPLNYQLSLYEKYLYNSHKSGSLSGVAMLFDKINSDVLYKYYNFQLQFFQNKCSLETVFSSFISDSNQLLLMYEKPFENDWNRYTFLITLYTYYNNIPKIINQLVNSEKALSQSSQYSKHFDEMNKLLNTIQFTLANNSNLSFIDKFSNDLIIKMNQ